MDIDIRLNGKALNLSVENPHRVNMNEIMQDIIAFGNSSGTDISALDIEQLVPRMIRGVAGCEGGCPADAKNLVKKGFGEFHLAYIEGGILSARRTLDDTSSIEIRIFPDFD